LEIANFAISDPRPKTMKHRRKPSGVFFWDDEPGSAQKAELPRLSLPQNVMRVGVGNPWGYIGEELGAKW
jgi:hypothetical protein